MANLALNVTINWRVLISVVSILTLALLSYYSGLWKQWRMHFSSRLSIVSAPDENVQTSYLTWNDNINEAVFYRQIVAENSKFAVLLLHGQKFISKTWQDIGTLKALSSKGFTAIAADLPQYGDSKLREPKDNKEKIQFLSDLIKKLNLQRPVLVAPSMSGSYAMPFVMDEEHSKELRGFIPVAPTTVAVQKEADLEKLKLPTLLVYGEKDTSFEPYVEKMKKIPSSEVYMMKNAQHPCYLDDPGDFHQRVIKFLEKLD